MTKKIAFPMDANSIPIPAPYFRTVIQGAAGAASSTIDLTETNMSFAISGDEEFYVLPVATAVGTVAAATGICIPKGSQQFWTSPYRYLAIIAKDVPDSKVYVTLLQA
jgi:hypothetical protein